MTKGNKLKIGLDFHGVITDNPAYFKVFANEALHRGHEVHIISGGPQATIEKFLQEWGIQYTNIFAIVDYYDARGCVTFYENGEFKVPDKLWNSAKASYCKKNGIDIHIDDTMSYSGGFATHFCFYDVKTRHCRTQNEKIINLEVSPLASLDDIETFVHTHRHK